MLTTEQLNKAEVSSENFSNFIHFDKYAKHIELKDRREIYEETVLRNKNMHIKKFPQLKEEIDDAYDVIFEKESLPSMRSMQFAGEAIFRNAVRLYNCSGMNVDDVDCFSETMFLLLSGTGVGYSVQKHHVAKLPPLFGPKILTEGKKPKRYLVGDSIEGWSDSIKVLVESYFYGKYPIVFDFSDIRAKGARLITSGGKAPGSEPLKECIKNVKKTLDNIIYSRGKGSYIKPIEVHDILCYIADAVLAGGIRRAACLSLFSYDDDEMLNCKGNFKIENWDHLYEEGPVSSTGEPNKVIQIHVGADGKKFYDLEVEYNDIAYGKQKTIVYWVTEENYEILNGIKLDSKYVNGDQWKYNILSKKEGTLPWYYFQPQRGRSNNSISLVRDKIHKEEFDTVWHKIEDSLAGEPGFFFTNDKDWVVNPCCEVSLRSNQFCNLVTLNASKIKTQESFNRIVKSATFIATLQASYTNFHYLRPVWQEVTEKDALIGVSITGIADNDFLKLNEEEAAKVVLEENDRVSRLIGINKAARTTAIKPEGTTSSLLNTSSGIHAWHDKYYIRRVRVRKNTPIYWYFYIYHTDMIKDEFYDPKNTSVIEFPIMSPNDAIYRTESAIDLLQRAKRYQKNWVKTGHRSGKNRNNVSLTVSIRPYEWGDVGEFIWDNKNDFTGISVLPYDSGTYIQAPFESVSKEEFIKLIENMERIDLARVIEEENNVAHNETVACGGGVCEVK